MAKRCPGCGHINDDARIFCAACGETLDANLRLIQNLEKQKHVQKASAPRREDDDDFVPPKTVKEEEKSPLLWIILGVVVVAAVAAWFLLT